MDLFSAGTAVSIRHPSASSDAALLAQELAARLDELTVGATTTFSAQVQSGLPAADESALYVGLATDWAAELGLPTAPGWDDTTDMTIRVARRADQFKPGATARECHVLARDGPLLLRAAWLLLHALGWRHYLPNGVAGLQDLWLVKAAKDTLSLRSERTWVGAVDHALGSIAGGTTTLNWSDGTDHFDPVDHPLGLLEGDLKGAMGEAPQIEAAPAPTWLRHMGWTMSSHLQVNEAWKAIVAFDPVLAAWDEALATGHYTLPGYKLYTDHADVKAATVAYAESKVQTAGLDWVSVARPDGDGSWDEDFGDLAFGAKLPVTRQIELANHTAGHVASAAGIVIQAYGRCAESPVSVWPDPQRVCVIVAEAYRPPGKTVEAVVADYVDESGAARCPLGLYQYLHSSAWGLGGLTANAASPAEIVAAANRLRSLPACRPKVASGEAMTEFGAYAVGYYAYMRMVLEIGRRAEPFTQADFDRHAARFLADLYPTEAVRTAVQPWYDALLDKAHKPLLSSHLLHTLWTALTQAHAACTAGSAEELRLVELAKFTRYLDLRNAFEAALADEPTAGEAGRLATEAAYDAMMEFVFRVRDSGLVDPSALFAQPLDQTSHDALALSTIYGALNEPPLAGRGSGSRPAWSTAVPTVAETTDPVSGWIAAGLAANAPHGLDDIAYDAALTWDSTLSDSRARQPDAAIRPYYAKGKTRTWLVPGGDTFTCTYTVSAGDGGAVIEFVRHDTLQIVATVIVDPVTLGGTSLTTDVALTAGVLHEMRLTTYTTGDRLWLDWWSGSSTRHGVSFDPGRDGDPGGFQQPLKRSYYFQVPDGITEIHFFADNTDAMALYLPDGPGGEVQDLSFQPLPRRFQRHPVVGSGRRVLRIAGVHINQVGFWLLNCPNLFAWHPDELLAPPGV